MNMPKKKKGKKKITLQDCLPQNFLVLKVDTSKEFAFFIMWDVFLQQVNVITSLAIGVQKKDASSAKLYPTQHIHSTPLIINDLGYMRDAYIAVIDTDAHWRSPDSSGVLHIPCIRVSDIISGIARGDISQKSDVRTLPHHILNLKPIIKDQRPLIQVDIQSST